MAEMLPWLVAPENNEDFEELERNMNLLTHELYVKSQIVAATMNYRLAHPKAGSKWAQKLMWLRIDLRAYARSVTGPIAKSGAAAVALGKAWRVSLTRYQDIRSMRGPESSGSGRGFDFG